MRAERASPLPPRITTTKGVEVREPAEVLRIAAAIDGSRTSAPDVPACPVGPTTSAPLDCQQRPARQDAAKRTIFATGYS